MWVRHSGPTLFAVCRPFVVFGRWDYRTRTVFLAARSTQLNDLRAPPAVVGNGYIRGAGAGFARLEGDGDGAACPRCDLGAAVVGFGVVVKVVAANVKSPQEVQRHAADISELNRLRRAFRAYFLRCECKRRGRKLDHAARSDHLHRLRLRDSRYPERSPSRW